MSRPSRSLTRAESKRITRQRLLDSALELLERNGYAGLTATQISKQAGIAQPSFYVHFKDKDDLLRCLAREHADRLRLSLRRARKRLREDASAENVRATFRIPLQAQLEHPTLFRVFARERSQPGSPVGELARELAQDLLDDLVEDLVGLGLPAGDEREREKVVMIAEGMMALIETWGIGHLEGRYSDPERIVDLLVAYSHGVVSA